MSCKISDQNNENASSYYFDIRGNCIWLHLFCFVAGVRYKRTYLSRMYGVKPCSCACTCCTIVTPFTYVTHCEFIYRYHIEFFGVNCHRFVLKCVLSNISFSYLDWKFMFRTYVVTLPQPLEPSSASPNGRDRTHIKNIIITQDKARVRKCSQTTKCWTSLYIIVFVLPTT